MQNFNWLNIKKVVFLHLSILRIIGRHFCIKVQGLRHFKILNSVLSVNFLRRIIILTIVFLPFQSSAKGLGKSMAGFFKGSGMSNVSKGGAYHDQASGYYTGGSYVSRIPIETVRWGHLQAPSLNIGCNGIDLFMGGFSFVQSKELVAMGKSIVSNAIPYATKLALKTMAPAVENTIDSLQRAADFVNQGNMSSCEAAQDLLGGVWPKSAAASKEICARAGTSTGAFSDWAAARHGCTTGGDSTKHATGLTGEFEDVLGDEYNITWQAIQKNSFLNQSKTQAELFMSISGTIVSKIRDKKHADHKILPSLALDNDLIKALMDGGVKAKFYSCPDKNKCLEVKKQEIKLAAKDGITYHVRQIIQSIKTKLIEGGSLTDREKGFIEQTNLPILKMITLSVIHSRNKDYVGLDSSDHVELISYDILLNYLQKILDQTSQSINHIRVVQLVDNDIKDMLDQIFRVKQYIANERMGLFQRAEANMKFVDAARSIEQRDIAVFFSSQEEGH